MFNIFTPKWKRGILKLQEERSQMLSYRSDLADLLFGALGEKVFSDKYLSTYDRYTLEFVIEIDNKWSDNGLYFNLRIYNQYLDVVYNFNNRLYDVESGDIKTMEQRKLELEYWLSLDWRKDEK